MEFVSTTSLRPQSVKARATDSATASRTGPRFTVDRLGYDDLAGHRESWESLAAQALEPNCFYEPWMLLPAVRRLAGDVKLEFILVYREDRGGRELCGFFPFERRRCFRRIPVRVLSLWKHRHAVLCLPLLHREHAADALQACLRWTGTDRHGGSLVDMPYVPGEGRFAQVLVDVINQLGCMTFPVESFTRALLRPAANAESYIQAALAPKHRRELQRLRRRLGDLGKLEVRSLEPGDDPRPWIEQFLQLEARGWKGAEQTALACTDNERGYFADIVTAAHARGQLMMLGLFVNGAAVALKCNFRAGDGAFALKIAFDERYDKFSPGVQLELDNIALAHRLSGLAWMDSCAIANHSMINRLWTERRTIQHILLSTGRWPGELLLGLLPLARALKRCGQRWLHQPEA
ncbi:MAG: GNAT family N-acetyltransferase [Gemmataceae bacterium]|nr:GNAT family N-acetyltransferase [Gemmataceae bacterium]